MNNKQLEIMIKVIGLIKIFCIESVQIIVLNEISIDILEGEFVVIMGFLGCGKLILLNILGLLDNLIFGELWFIGKEVFCYLENDCIDMWNGNIGFVFQSFNLIDELIVFENVELLLLYVGVLVCECVD